MTKLVRFFSVQLFAVATARPQLVNTIFILLPHLQFLINFEYYREV